MSVVFEYSKKQKRYLVEWSSDLGYWHEEGSFNTLFRAKLSARFHKNLGYNVRITDQRAVEPLTQSKSSGSLKGLFKLKEKK